MPPENCEDSQTGVSASVQCFLRSTSWVVSTVAACCTSISAATCFCCALQSLWRARASHCRCVLPQALCTYSLLCMLCLWLVDWKKDCQGMPCNFGRHQQLSRMRLMHGRLPCLAGLLSLRFKKRRSAAVARVLWPKCQSGLGALAELHGFGRLQGCGAAQQWQLCSLRGCCAGLFRVVVGIVLQSVHGQSQGSIVRPVCAASASCFASSSTLQRVCRGVFSSVTFVGAAACRKSAILCCVHGACLSTGLVRGQGVVLWLLWCVRLWRGRRAHRVAVCGTWPVRR